MTTCPALFSSFRFSTLLRLSTLDVRIFSPTALLLPALLAALAAAPALGEAVRNGNELALAYGETNAAGRAQLARDHTRLIHTFRFLKIESIAYSNGPPVSARVTTVEPSSDLKVVLCTDGKLSLKLLGDLKEGDCLAARGRVTSIGGGPPATLVVDPAVLQFKDRGQPKAGKELLREVDKAAN